MKIRIKLGVEHLDRSGMKPVRKVRLTPVDETVDASDQVGTILLLLAGVADQNDIEPGDGEFDLHLMAGKDVPEWLRKSPFFAKNMQIIAPFLKEDWNLFIRLSPV
jgi:hypothetical protein